MTNPLSRRAEMIKIWKIARQLYFFRNFRGNSYTKAFLSAIMLIRMTSPVWMEGCVSALAGLSAVIFIPDDTPKTGFSRPMMLQNIMGTPLLSWLASSLMAGGVGRFFLVCHERFKREARACFPDDVEFSCPSVEVTSDQLHVFLSTADETEEDIIVVTGPAVILPFAADEEQFDSAPIASPVTSVSKAALMAALDEKFIFTAFLKDHGVPYTDRDGVYGQTSIGKNCTIGPNSYLENARVGDGTKVNASQIYNSSVGYDTHVGPFAYIRPGSNVGNCVRVGDFVEIKNSNVSDGTKISHLTYVGDSDVGKNVNFGCGTVTVNYDRAKKYRTVIEDSAFIGCNTNLIAPVRVGEGAYIAAGSTITDDIPAMALSIARARQQNKRDWASKHKLKEK